MARYVCQVCGYVYDPAQGDPDNGVAAGTPFEKLPDDWECPVCGASKADFVKEACSRLLIAIAVDALCPQPPGWRARASPFGISDSAARGAPFG